jgi:hypothetical protein
VTPIPPAPGLVQDVGADTLAQLDAELLERLKRYPPFNSTLEIQAAVSAHHHELQHDLWHAFKHNSPLRLTPAARETLMQLTAICLRALLDCPH